jgi:hypothetical protein
MTADTIGMTDVACFAATTGECPQRNRDEAHIAPRLLPRSRRRVRHNRFSLAPDTAIDLAWRLGLSLRWPLLPGSGDPEYRIKSANEPHQRAARESELNKA